MSDPIVEPLEIMGTQESSKVFEGPFLSLKILEGRLGPWRSMKVIEGPLTSLKILEGLKVLEGP